MKGEKDMKNKICLLGALLLMLTANSCRQDADTINNYSTSDMTPFVGADTSFEKQFEIFWHGMDQNYCLFAYDRTFGLDWDAVYDEFLPQFKALDEKDYVSDTELNELLIKATSGLHDGHFNTTFKNYHTGQFVKVSPAGVAIRSRSDALATDSFSLNLNYYLPVEMEGNGEFKNWYSASSDYIEYFSDIHNNYNKGLRWIGVQLFPLYLKAENNQLTEHEAFLMAAYTELRGKLQKILDEFNGKESIIKYNELVSTYSYLNVPGLLPYDLDLIEGGITASTGVTKDNIAYFYMSDFALTPCVSDSIRNEEMDDSSPNAIALVEAVGFVWKQWFNSVQSLIKSGQLKGVIIDLRSNGGGLMSDFPYVVGSLLPSGSHQIGYGYSKRGVGRFDYSVNMPFQMDGLEQPHETITNQPVVILTNCYSVSMSEISTLAAKELLNACQIGTTTWGGLCGLTGNDTYGYNYAGYVGIENKTAVYCYIPQIVFSDLDGVIHEGVGIKPDIEVVYDAKLFRTQGRDNQFERALQYIRENN